MTPTEREDDEAVEAIAKAIGGSLEPTGRYDRAERVLKVLKSLGWRNPNPPQGAE